MPGSEILTIGSVARHRGEYNKDTVYYTNNQVTMYGCVFQALSNNFSNKAPLTVASDKTISLANTNLWKCIINNVDLYNATLSTNNINSRVTTIENSVDTIKQTAQSANEAAQSATKKADAALSTANTTKQAVSNLTQRVDDNQDRIQDNTIAIEALQKNASPLEIICSTKTIAFEPDGDGKVALSVPIYIYDKGKAITDKAVVTVAIYTPVQTGLMASWDGTNVTANINVPGKHIIDMTATYQGKTASAKFDLYLTLPTTVSTFSDDEEIQLVAETTTGLPLKLTVTKTGDSVSELLFNTPAYLNAEKITCNGIDVPIISDVDSKDNYVILSTFEEIVSGTYDFIIQ